MEKNKTDNKFARGYVFTSECVTEGHPDKVCDQISDGILDACLAQDSNSRVACECLATKDLLVIAGEVTTKAKVDYDTVARQTLKKIGYNKPGFGFDDTCEIICRIQTQSPDIAMGVDRNGAGDQGMMFGGACDETEDLMPLPISLSRALTNRITWVMKNTAPLDPHGNPIIRPDGKSQVTVKYTNNGIPLGIDTIVVSVQHTEAIKMDKLRDFVKKEIIAPVLEDYGFSLDTVSNIFINPTGKFVLGGPAADTGLTGRKIIVDTYGGYFSHGGGAFSGKDPTKVDRSGAYMARYIAKNIVASGVASKVEVQLAYAIGLEKPVSVNIKTFGTSKYPISLIAKAVYKLFDTTPQGIIKTLHLNDNSFRYQDLASSGHFGGFDLPWERIDKAQEIYLYCEDNYTPRSEFDKK